jgi:transcription elongation GreA/GreB family factor
MDKKFIHALCLEIIELKLNDLKTEILELNQSVQNETKSSAGDKHETSRAMIQQEIDFANQRLKELQFAKIDLDKINPLLANKSVNTGSLIETNIGLIYFTIALGKIKLKNLEVNVLSIQSPIGKLLKGKKLGEKINLNGKEIIIYSIYQ